MPDPCQHISCQGSDLKRQRSDLIIINVMYTILMPAKNRLKKYHSQAYYHIYNRGIDKRNIFLDAQDYLFFQQSLSQYLTPVVTNVKKGYKTQKPSLTNYRQSMNLTNEVKLCVYCLMPNHFHLIVRQESSDAITKLMRRICTQYAMYFNKKYKRQGTLFENIYRAVLIPEDDSLLLLSRYIHLNPVAKTVRRFGLVETAASTLPEEYPYSSFHSYLSEDNNLGVETKYIKKLLNGQTYDEYMHSDIPRWQLRLTDIALDLDEK
jgi:putative transposase